MIHNITGIKLEIKSKSQYELSLTFQHLNTEVVPVNQPFHALVCWFEEEIWTETSEEERDAGIQLFIHFFGLNASLQCQRCATEQRFLKLQEGRFNSQELLQSCAACGRRGGWVFQKDARHCNQICDKTADGMQALPRA